MVTGSSGLIGSALVPALWADGHTVVRLVRRPPAGPDEARWDPEAGEIDRRALEGADGVVHLAGAGIASRRWTAAQKRRILASRVRGTTAMSIAVATLERPPGVMVSGSAIGYYGDRGDEELTEHSGPGQGFLAEVVLRWEAATEAARDAGVRVVTVRTGIVLSGRGGAMGPLLPLFRLGLGGRVGAGRQWWSWVSLEDEVGIIRHALSSATLSGPVNATAPAPVTNAEFARTLGAVLRRPAILPAPRPALELVLGRELAQEVLLASQRVLPARATADGYDFVHRDLESALRSVLGRPAAATAR